MKAIVDCNSFYCSCEKLFRPELENKPVIVLSNNDGCIIARSDEAKAFGIGMAGPYFKAKPLIEKHGITTFSSNYNLYGDLSWRVMETLRQIAGEENVEVYSVDEAFLNLEAVPQDSLYDFATQIKETIELWTGIKVSVGVAATKVLAKVANRLCKKNKAATNCIMVLDSTKKIEAALQQTAIDAVWGIGYQYAEKLKRMGINTAFDLSIRSPEFGKKYLGGIVGVRLIRELKGIPSIGMKDELTNKKMIATTRMFGEPITELHRIQEAIATYTARAAEKLRRQKGAAQTISIFLVAKQENLNASFHRGTSVSSYATLPVATAQTNLLIKPALAMAERIFTKGTTYKKAGVLLYNIIPDQSIQGNLFVSDNDNKGRLLMDVIDNINFSQRNDVLKFASSGTQRNWKMQQNFNSPKYTSRWKELCGVK